MSTSIKFDNISKQYRLGLVSTNTLSHDLTRWFTMNIRGKEDPYLKIGETNDREHKGTSDYVWALKDINYEVKQGDVVGIIGKNGAGKSTLLKILSKVTAPTTGTIKAKGRIASLLEVGTGFHPEMTGKENIFMNGAIMGMTKSEISRKFDEIVDFSGVARYIDTPVKRYSSGMTVRLGFAIAAYLEPEILVVDEVLAVGDAEFQKKAIGKMQDVSKGEGRTVLFVSHNMGAVRGLCNKGILMNNGQISFTGNIFDTVNNYLRVNKELSSKMFDERQDRVGTGLIRASSISIKTMNDEHIENVISGQDFKIVLNYYSQAAFTLERINVSFSFTDENESPLFLIHNRMTGQAIKVENGAGKFECVILKNPLNSGLYNVSYSIMAENGFGGFIDGIPNAIELCVQSGDFYQTGEIAPRDFGPILVDANFLNFQ